VTTRLGKLQKMELFRSAAGLLAEVMFVIVPLVVIYLVSIQTSHGSTVLTSPEWSVGSIILFGQVMVKFTLGVAHKGGGAPGPLALILVLLVMLGILPSCLLLIYVVASNEASACHLSPTFALTWINPAQMVVFIIAIIVYLSLGLLSEVLLHGRHTGKPS